jgi:hypothetical protein
MKEEAVGAASPGRFPLGSSGNYCSNFNLTLLPPT